MRSQRAGIVRGTGWWVILTIRDDKDASDERMLTMDAEGSLTPAMRQYRAAKESYPDALLFFRMGDFYELFFEDAIVAAKELELTLTARDKLKAVPMCGVPYHAAEVYLQRLLRRGFRVAICEQMEDPKLAKGVVKREVTRVLTPGTAADPALGGEQSNWLVSLTRGSADRSSSSRLAATSPGLGASSPILGGSSHPSIGLAMLDLSTGEFQATEFDGENGWAQALDEVARIRPAELLLQATVFDPANLLGEEGDRDGLAAVASPRTTTSIDDWVFTAEYAVPLLKKHFQVHSLDGFGLAGHEAAAVAAGALIEYMQRTKQGPLHHVDSLRFYGRSTCLELDAVSVRNLELVDPLFTGEASQVTLFSALDACLTPMGRRLLRSWLLRPASEVREIDLRLDAVGEASGVLRQREELRRSLDGTLDLERLLGRLALDSAGPREMIALAATLRRLPAIGAAMRAFASERWRQLGSEFDTLGDVEGRIRRTLVEEPPVSIGEGSAVREGIDAELDELRDISRNGRQAIAAIEERERARTGIGSLKVRFNNVFGYYLEVTKANAKSIPADYERKQTLVNAERYTTPELKELEGKILTAQERCGEIERRIFAELRGEVLGAAGRVRVVSRKVAQVDVLACFAHLTAMRGWMRPAVDGDGVLEIVGGRHPVVEKRLEEQGLGRFVPNSLFVVAGGEVLAKDDSNQEVYGPSTLLITGPNMGGKSTYLRMAALVVIMAQCGCFVPAERMRLGLVDRIFTRIGASDNVARGRSTFMVEMTETAAILNTATSRSLVLLDEMGRGTATYDGLSLAWATVEHLHNRVGARTLFATHYHELTMLEERLKRLKNLRVTVKESGGGIIFLHAVETGAASKSYGIEVARLAGLPAGVIARAREVLKVHERAEMQQVREAAMGRVPMAGEAPLQMTMFTPLSQRIVDRLGEVDVDEMTPREALNLLAELKRELRG